MTHINDLHDENVVQILSYLRATDLVNAREVDKIVFSGVRISSAIDLLLKEVYTLPISSPVKKNMCELKAALRRPDQLYIKEISSIAFALSSHQPLPPHGYWISSSWLSNAKKYVDSLAMPTGINELSNRKSPSKKKAPARQRRGSDLLPPWPAINAEILCPHGGLSVSGAGIKTKRRAISAKMWHFLRRFYPDGPQFRCAYDEECVLCLEGIKDAKTAEVEKKGLVAIERRTDLVPDALASLAARRSGVPADFVSSKVALINELSELGGEDGPSAADLHAMEQALLMDGDGMLQQPLVPGLYNLVPKRWLKAWRHYIKDASAPFLPHLDCAAFLCQPHGLLVVPPHVEEYLVGLRRTLLAGLGAYPGEVAEIVSADEWDALQDVFHGAADFSVRLCLDGVGISWNTGVCMRCDPFAYTPLLPSANRKKTRNSQQVGGLIV